SPRRALSSLSDQASRDRVSGCLTMVSHKEFESAGKQPGLQIWRIENMDLKPVPKPLHGSFFTGDSYIVLQTTAAPSYNIHMWLGEWASALSSHAQTRRLRLFPVSCTRRFPALLECLLGYLSQMHKKFQIGGVASGFKHVVTNDANVKRLLHIKGRRIIRATEVDLSWGSFNKGDCFIIDLGKDIYQWCGSECNRFERLKASQVAIDIRNNERNGRAKITMVEEDAEPQEIIAILGAKPGIPPGGPDDEAVETANKNKGSLYMVSDATGSMKTSLVAQSSPFKQAMLSPDECYILDNGVDNKLFLWKGSNANTGERKAAMKTAEQFIKDKNYSSKTQMRLRRTSNLSHAGSKSFKKQQFYFDSHFHQHGLLNTKPVYWNGFSARSYCIREKHKKCTDRKSSACVNLPVLGSHPALSRTKSGGAEPQPPFSPQVKACASSLNTNDVFVLKAPDATYVWRGVGATEEEVAAAKHVVAMLKGSASEVSEGKEPAGFWAALGGKKEYQTSRSLQKAVTPPRLFGCSNKTGRLVAEEVPGDFTQADLATDDVMLLDAGDQIFLWIGNEANDVEKTGAPKIAKEYVDSDPSGRRGIPVTTVKQGHEPPTFTGWFMAWDSNMWDTDPLDRIRAHF
uniref:Gelsolin-like domain-containing protein n=1 Tax=Lepisosteus oculatus TaxID=7918 RepID=W5MAW0_LEPOC